MKPTRVWPFALLFLATLAQASNYALEEIPSAIPAADAAKLKAQGISTTFQLLEKAADPKARRELAHATKLPLKSIDGWAKLADVMRIKGVGPDVAHLLAACEVLTVAQLKTQDPAKLNDAITKVNSTKKLSENPPSAEHLEAWIAQAKTLPIVLH